IAVELEDLLEALCGIDAPVVPVVKRMRAAAGDAYVEPLRGPHDGVAQFSQLGRKRLMPLMHRRVELDHALGDFRLDRTGMAIFFDQADQIGRVARQVVVSRVQDLQLELGADRERRRSLELQIPAHGCSPGSFASPACRKANWTASGPNSSRTTAADRTMVESLAVNSG